ncbi:Malic enzyme [Rubrobacter radiotolerans]|uniref:Malic enzyme n=1 Tax=Rubrobacter radiotolerans TaxID=42256 RepID=A0A023X203_RUBRA|nr:malic enzyme-like NAD(P)-binding protein [Rubrobacter radiotolerans]AHY46383.1 Malic enzyme [Rubrobacter radiotolerans]MDX5893790.1 malic enzyme-like NAD(P)-binding protein [Rubrobacter radiotolerans]SMC04510.1 malate dehydrogenase (oxaloacetate-decarboxylating) [Rubrobacter radiotolerans DSM 5868]
MEAIPSASYSSTLRVEFPHRAGALGQVLITIGEAGGLVGAVDIVRVGEEMSIRDITVNARDSEHAQSIVRAVEKLPEVRVVNVSDRTFLMHLGGKIEVRSKMQIRTRDDLSMAYTPGVARVCRAIHEDPERAFNLTIKRNTVAVVSDGTAVLGLGDIGPRAAMPVMEGKAMLFKEFANVDAFPICLDTKDPDEIVETVKRLAPGFGGINLEDISAPRCFEIEDRLKRELDIPVFHDDQHGTAVVVLAALINALKITGKRMEEVRAVFSGVGAAGVACAKILMAAGVKNIVGCDSRGIVHPERDGLDTSKGWFAGHTNPEGLEGTLTDAVKGADLFVGLSVPNVLTVDHLKTMSEKPIIFAMANPDPEIRPELAYEHAGIVATGRSDYPNQINNVLCFPGIFRGALDIRAREITEEMKLAAANAIAGVIPEDAVAPDYIIPSVFDERVAPAVAEAVAEAGKEDGAARRIQEQAETDFQSMAY